MQLKTTAKGTNMNLTDLEPVPMTLHHVSFIQACRTFFGNLPGQGLKEFVEEIRGLTVKDREDLIAEFRKVGIDATKVS
jgi:hypothetical protein